MKGIAVKINWICLLISLCTAPFGIHAVSSYVYQNEVNIDGEIQILAVKEDEEPVDAIYAFGEKHGLDQGNRFILLNDLCKTLHCTRTKARLWSSEVNKNNSYVGTFYLYEGIEPVDAAHEFVVKYNLTLGYRHAILTEACEFVECSRLQPVIWEKKIDVGQEEVVVIRLVEGDEVADTIFRTMQPYRLSYQDRQQIMAAAKEDGIPYKRDQALLFNKSIVFEEEDFKQNLVIFDDGREPIDILNEFAESQNIDYMLERLSEKILPEICGLLMCTRSVPVIWSHEISSVNGEHIGFVEVAKNEEPVDAVDRFATIHSLSGKEVYALLKFVCENIPCNRDRPVVYRKSINDEDGKLIGNVEVLEGEEVIDAVVRFIRQTSTGLDEIAFKNLFFQHACDEPRLKCTRNVAHVFENSITDEDGKVLGKLTITEHEEPADKVYQFCEENNMQDHAYQSIMDQVCSSDLVTCNRQMPLVTSIPLRDPDGNFIGDLEIELKKEPVDVLYKFFATHDLFQKEWDFVGVSNQICELQNVICTRRRAIKFYADSILMGGIDIGPMVIWDNEEVIDILFEKRMELNLTEADQMMTFGHICGRREIYCERTQAKIYELNGITKRDYEKFGNETCHRKFAGWQFLESVGSSSFFGSKAKDVIKLESVERSIGSPLFAPFFLLMMLCITYVILMQSFIKSKIHIGHKVVIYSAVFLFVALSQAIFIEPESRIDLAMHIHEGRLPDIVILENQEPVDIILRWGKLAAKDHHPIVREPIYWDILEKVCNEIKFISCERQRAWEYIDMGSISVSGQTHKIDYYNPEVEPFGQISCRTKGNETSPCVEKAVNSICKRIYPQLSQCSSDLVGHITSQLAEYNSKRLKSKDTYIKLGLEMDAPDNELYPKMVTIARSLGMNIPPFNKVGNGTASLYYDWDDHTTDAYAARDAYHKVRDVESREWNDKPCTPYFGGALCAKNDKEGNMIIEM